MSTGVNQYQGEADNLRGIDRDSNSNQDESTAKELLKFAGTWQGDDLEECLEEVYKTRTESSIRLSSN